MGVGACDRDWDVNIVGERGGGGEVGKQGRGWDTDIVGVGTEIAGCLVNVTDLKKHVSNSCCFDLK